MTTLAAVHPVLPPHRYPQAEITDTLLRLCDATAATAQVARRMHAHTQVGHRNLALPLDRYATLDGFTAANGEFLRCAEDLAAQAVTGAVRRAGLAPADVDAIVSTTVTGIAVPSLDARIAHRVGLRPDVVRLPLFGLGCAAGVAGIARVNDYLLAHPDRVAVLLSVELCSLTLQRDDPSTANLVASGLFGDGAAAVVAVGADRQASGPEVLGARSRLYPDTVRTMGWDAGSGGLRIVLSAQVPDLVREYLGDDVRKFLAEHGTGPSEIGAWITHPGGPKVIDAIESELDLPPDALDLTRRSLAAVGNMSSASVLHVLADTLRQRPPAGDALAQMIAMGPGFCSEQVLLRW